jgi:hypothetical protein
MPKAALIKPTHKAIKEYHQALKDYQEQRVTHEGALETAFQRLRTVECDQGRHLFKGALP